MRSQVSSLAQVCTQRRLQDGSERRARLLGLEVVFNRLGQVVRKGDGGPFHKVTVAQIGENDEVGDRGDVDYASRS